MTHRFFVPADCISGDHVTFTTDQRKQIRNVLRLRPGDAVSAFDGSGREFSTELTAVDSEHAQGKILECTTPNTEPKVRLTLVQSLPKGEKLDLILQKCTEIGVSEFLMMETARSVPKIPQAKLPGRLERWRSIVKEAAEQSGRVCLPAVDGVASFRQALTRVRNHDACVIAWEEETGITLSSDLPNLREATSIAYIVGPEGGFAPEEVLAARAEGITPISLGSRILRTETAAIVGSALIIYGLQS